MTTTETRCIVIDERNLDIERLHDFLADCARRGIAVRRTDEGGHTESLRAIARELGIGLNAVLYLDDPARFSNLDAYLRWLDTRISVSRFDRERLPQIAHLVGRCQEFNLTGSSYTEAECEALIHDSHALPLAIELSDRLTSYGLIGVLTLLVEDDEMQIRDWLLDSRVTGRGVEEYLMNLAVSEAQSRGFTRLRGEYIRTPANGALQDFFAQFGFTLLSDDPDHALWILPLAAYEPVEQLPLLPANA